MNSLFAQIKQIWLSGSVNSQVDVEEEFRCSSFKMLVLAFLVGVFGGFASIAFVSVLAFFMNLFFYGTLSLHFNTEGYLAPSSWGALVILVPVLASFLVTWVTKTYAPEARGHGVPEVLNAIYHLEGRIRPNIVVAKAIVSAISIGTGGSVGREGPLVQMGSAFGSFIGQIVRMPTRQRITLIAAGAASAIAATFNAPIGGLCFALELLLVSISARTITIVAVATVTANYIGHVFNGVAPSFDIPMLALSPDHALRLASLLFCIPLGILVGLAAALFIRTIYFAEHAFAASFKNDYVRHATGMLMVGCLIYAFLYFTGHYYVAGIGYAAVLDSLKGLITDPWFLLILFVAKLLATTLTIGSGASGGIFSPSIFLGAMLGAAFGNLVNLYFPALGISPVIYTISGIAAMVAGSTGTVLTAIIMTFEQTRDYSVILPIILTVSIAHLVRVRVCAESIYTLKLALRGTHVPQGLTAAVSMRAIAKHIMSTDFATVELQQLPTWLTTYMPGRDPRYTVIVQEGEVLGMVSEEQHYFLRDAQPDRIVDQNIFFVNPSTKWAVLMRGMKAKNTENILVMKKSSNRESSALLGIITPSELVKHSGKDAELME